MEVLVKSLNGRDHYPIRTKIGTETCQKDGTRIPRWKSDKANWEVFQILSGVRCVDLHREDVTNVEEFNKMITTVTCVQTAEKTIPKSRGGKGKKCVPWWDENCDC